MVVEYHELQLCSFAVGGGVGLPVGFGVGFGVGGGGEVGFPVGLKVGLSVGGGKVGFPVGLKVGLSVGGGGGEDFLLLLFPFLRLLLPKESPSDSSFSKDGRTRLKLPGAQQT